MRNLKTHIGHVESNLRQAERDRDELMQIRAQKITPKILKHTSSSLFMFIRELFLSLHYAMKISDQNFKDIEARLQKLEKEGG